MDQSHPTAAGDMGTLAEDARALLDATADMAGEKVASARERLHAALADTKKIAANVRANAADSAKAMDDAVRENPYQALAIGVGVGALIGFFLARRLSYKGD